MNQIDFMIRRYPDHTIGFSSHEYRDWLGSMMIAYAKGARTLERHVDIEDGGIPVSPYCSLPEHIDAWFKAFHKAREMCGGASSDGASARGDLEYLDALVRGVYARRPLETGYVLSKESFDDDLYLAIPLQKGQLSCREIMNGAKLVQPIMANEALTIDHIDGPYSSNRNLRELIMTRGH